MISERFMARLLGLTPARHGMIANRDVHYRVTDSSSLAGHTRLRIA